MKNRFLKKFTTYKGSKQNKNNYSINYTQADKYFTNLTFEKLEYKSLNTYGINKKACNIIKRQWIKAGYDKKLLKNIGYKKALQILNNL